MKGPEAPTTVPAGLEAASDMLEHLLLQVTAVPGQAVRMALIRETRRAARQVARLREGSLDESETFTQLRTAQACTERLRLRLEQLGESSASLAATAAAVGEALTRHRREAVTQAVAAGAPGSARAEYDGGFSPSLGWPELFASSQVTAPLVGGAAGEGDDEDEAWPSFDVDELFAEALAKEDDERSPAPEPPAPAPELPGLVPLRHEQPTGGADITTPGRAGELAQLRRLGRDCLDEIGVMGNLRRLEGDEPWVDAVAGYERRLLCALDALMAYGEAVAGGEVRLDVAELALEHADQATVDDPFRCFARTLVLGSLSGEDKVRAAVMGLRRSDPRTHRAQQDALILAPSPHVDGAMRRLCRDLGGEPLLVRLALRVLHGRRVEGLPEAVALLEHPDHEVRAWAARCLAVAEPALAEAWLGELASSEAEDDAVVVAALEAQLWSDRPRALGVLRGRLEEELAEPAVLSSSARRQLTGLLAMGGEACDTELLSATVARHPAEFDALGWHGDGQHCAALLTALQQPGQTAMAAAAALHRITGARICEEGASPYQPARNLDRWLKWWAAEGDRFEAGRRYRLGEPYTLEASRDELAILGVPIRIREGLAYELAIALGEPRVNVHGWVAVQRNEIGALVIPKDRCAAGGWPRVGRPS